MDYRETVSLRDIYDETIFDEGVPISLRSQRDTLSERGSFKPLTYRILVTQDGSGVPEDWVGIITPVHRRYVEDRVQNTPVPTLTNDGDEPTTRVTFTLLESPYYRIDPDYASITVRVRDLDPAPVLEIDSATAPKGAETFDFRVSFADDVPSLRNVTVDYRTEDGKAEAGQDYTETSGTLTIPAGETGGVISVPLLENRFAQAGSKFKMHIEDPSNASLASSEPATATLNYRPIVELTARHLAIETGETATFDLTRDGTPASELTVRVFASENNGRGGDVEGRGDHYATFAAGASTTVLDIEDVASISNPEHFLKVKVYQNSGLYENGDDDVAFVKVYDQLAYVSIAVDHETVVEGDIGDGEGKDAIFTRDAQGTIYGDTTPTYAASKLLELPQTDALYPDAHRRRLRRAEVQGTRRRPGDDPVPGPHILAQTLSRRPDLRGGSDVRGGFSYGHPHGANLQRLARRARRLRRDGDPDRRGRLPARRP